MKERLKHKSQGQISTVRIMDAGPEQGCRDSPRVTSKLGAEGGRRHVRSRNVGKLLEC